MLHANPVICREGINGPSSVETPDARVLLPAKGTEGQIVDRLIVDVGHTGFNLLREPQSSLEVTCEDGARQSVRRVVRKL